MVLYEKLARSDWMLVTMSPVKVLIKPVNDFTKRTIVLDSLSLLCSMLLNSLNGGPPEGTPPNGHALRIPGHRKDGANRRGPWQA